MEDSQSDAESEEEAPASEEVNETESTEATLEVPNSGVAWMAKMRGFVPYSNLQHDDSDKTIFAHDKQNRHWHNVEKRKIGLDLLRKFADWLQVITGCFIAASVIALVAMFLDHEWSTRHKDVIEVLKFGWTVSGTVLVTRMSNMIFRDHEQ